MGLNSGCKRVSLNSFGRPRLQCPVGSVEPFLPGQLQGILCCHVSVCEKIESNHTWKFVLKYSTTTPQEIIYSRSILETRKCTYLPAVLVDSVENGIPDCL
ncbi:hypothetical protein Tsp_08195 [Trichinella spiralis]|uniref:hypothetical protein n=1 Tax=Trichinella spiralis TaxID=6334 RepID=UPI0001EFE87D|nr:hypothetical protein Tsp_08195 [Trichinella spiralis]